MKDKTCPSLRSAASCFPIVCSLFTGAFLLFSPTTLRAQAVDIQVMAQFELYSTNVLDSTNWFSIDGVRTEVVGIAESETNCGPILKSPWVTITVPSGGGFAVYWDGIFCAPTNTGLIFSNIPNCAIWSLGGTTNHDFWFDECCVGYGYLDFSLTTDRGNVKFAPCDSLAADGKSTCRPYLSNPAGFSTNITWSIVGTNTLGCILTNGPLIIAGTNAGTITVRATDVDNCYVEGDLELLEVDESCTSNCTIEGGEFANGSLSSGSIDLRLSLGKSAHGKSAGFLHLHERGTTTNIHHATHLEYNYKRSDVDVIRDPDGYIRQVKTPQGLADIFWEGFTEVFYEVRFYSKTNVGSKGASLYPVIGTPFTVWKISSRSNLDETFLQIVETPQGGQSRTNIYERASDAVLGTDGWQLTHPSNLRVELSASALQSNSTVRVERKQIKSGSGDLVDLTAKKYQLFSWGERLLEESNGSGAAGRTNRYSYYTNGLVETALHADGSWEWYFYDAKARPVTVFSSYLNQDIITNRSLCRVIDYDYSTSVVSGSGDNGVYEPNTARKITESKLGNVVSVRYNAIKQFEKREIVCVTGTDWDSGGNLVTTNKYYDSGLFYGKLKTVDHPDGTMDLYEYATNNRRYETNSVWSGQPNSGRTAIIDGTKNVTVTGPVGEMISHAVIDATSIGAGSPITNSLEFYSDHDVFERPRKVAYLDGTYDYTVYAACCGQQIVTNRDGVVTTFSYDDLKRLQTSTANGITATRNYDAAGNLLSTVRTGTNATSITLSSASYDTARRKATRTNAVGNATAFSEAVYPVVKTTTLPNSATRVESFARDGTLLSVTGTGVHPVRYTNGFLSDGGSQRFFTAEIKLNSNGADLAEAVTNAFDLAGRIYKTIYAGTNGGAIALSYYNSRGQLTNRVDPDGISTIYAYDGKGEVEYTVLDMDRDGQIDFTGGDRITRTVNMVTNDSGLKLQRTLTYVWATSNDAPILSALSDRAVDGLRSWHSTFGLTNQTSIGYANGHKYITNSAPDGSYIVSDFQNGRLVSSYRKDPTGGYLSINSYSYDGHGRLTAVTNTPAGATTYTFDNADRVISATTPSPAETTSTIYDSMGWVATNLLSDGAAIISEYLLSGDLKKKYGARQYPVEFTYDSQGRMKTMKTWQNYVGNSGTAITTWNYDQYRGFLTGKVYADGNGPSYTYTPGGRLKTRTWARGVVTTYAFDNAGAVNSVSYSDATPSVTTSFDRRGRQLAVANGTNATSYIYNDAGMVLSEAYTAGLLNGFAVTNIYDSLNRRTANGVLSNGVWVTMTTNSYDPASRLAFISDGTNSAEYAYLTNSTLVSSIVMKSNSATRLTVAKGYDNLYRLTVISNIPFADSPMTFSYLYDSANQRTAVTNADGSRWVYAYDSLGQVTSGKRYWSDGVLVAGQQFEYAYDDIGNRKSAAAGGNEWGAGLQYQTYTVNNLNQYAQRTVPGAQDVIGVAHSNATVTVNLEPTHRHAEYFRADYRLINSTGVVYQALTNIAVLANGTNADIVTTNSGYALIPKTPEVYLHDLDGNLATNGLWSFTWDGENRLVALDCAGAVPDAAKKKLRFSYDEQGRRISKVVSNYNTGSWSSALSLKFVYDGWNLTSELNASNNAVLTSFLWGLDISGSFQGVGGVGGLLVETVAGAGTHLVAYDRNGNVAGLTDASTGIASAAYEYGPFGEAIRVSGPLAAVNRMRFSTKMQDQETDFLYYGRRFYALSSGRWTSRDPVAERVREPHVYAAMVNNAVNRLDSLGLWATAVHHQNIDDWLVDPIYKRFPWACSCIVKVRELLKDGSDEIDGQGEHLGGIIDAQSTANAYKHAMRAPDQTIAEAEAKYNSFVDLSISEARRLSDSARSKNCTSAPCNLIKQAVRIIGYAYHAISDKQSPAHTGFQLWTASWTPDDIAAHAVQETMTVYKTVDEQVVTAVNDQLAGPLAYVLAIQIK